MKILMLKTATGTDDGFKVRQFKRGEIVDVADFDGKCLMGNGSAMPAERGKEAIAKIRKCLEQQGISTKNASHITDMIVAGLVPHVQLTAY